MIFVSRSISSGLSIVGSQRLVLLTTHRLHHVLVEVSYTVVQSVIDNINIVQSFLPYWTVTGPKLNELNLHWSPVLVEVRPMSD